MPTVYVSISEWNSVLSVYRSIHLFDTRQNFFVELSYRPFLGDHPYSQFDAGFCSVQFLFTYIYYSFQVVISSHYVISFQMIAHAVSLVEVGAHTFVYQQTQRATGAHALHLVVSSCLKTADNVQVRDK